MSYNTYPQNPFPPNSENSGGGSFTLPIASTTELGGVKVGSGLAINAETGVLINNYELPIATPETLGGVIVDTDAGLYCTGGYIGVKVKQNGNLFFDVETGELFAYSWTPPAYTINETLTGKKWIDDSNIYQKVLNVGDLGVSGDGTYSHGITNFKNIISFNCIGISNDGYSFCNNGVILLSATNSTISYRKTFDTTGYNSYFVVEYTKTT